MSLVELAMPRKGFDPAGNWRNGSPAPESHLQRGWNRRWLPPTPVSGGSSERCYTITRVLAGELECSSRCGKRDRRLAS